MAETFYGPWNVRLDHVDPSFRQRFSISGSDNADGRYDVSSGVPLNLEVTGNAWSISLEIEPFPPRGEQAWDQRTVQRATRFEAPDGLIVQLDTIALPRLSLTCISMDPTVNPISPANPYDFTIPEH